MVEIISKIKQTLFVKSINEFKIDTMKLIALDFAFITSLILIFLSSYSALSYFASPLMSTVPTLEKLKEISNEDFQITDQMKNELAGIPKLFYNSLIILSIILILSILSIFSIISFFQGYIISKIKKIKFDWIYLKKFFMMTILWHLIFAAVFIIIFAITLANLRMVISAIFVFIYVYSTSIIFLRFSKDQKIFSFIWQSLKFGTVKIYNLIAPFILIYFLFLLLLVIVTFLNSIPIRILFIASTLIIFSTYLVWIKIYLNLVVNHVKE